MAGRSLSGLREAKSKLGSLAILLKGFGELPDVEVYREFISSLTLMENTRNINQL